jgi:hypothetical protein
MFGSRLSQAEKLEVRLMLVGFTRWQARCLAQVSCLPPSRRDPNVPRPFFWDSHKEIYKFVNGIFRDLMAVSDEARKNEDAKRTRYQTISYVFRQLPPQPKAPNQLTP